ncbi:response regulator [Paenibacillus hexagrammi]|uniref:Response regulator n=1 Tax=Paenibacillus hexagrammi TaxID=2908839 RepID=A0ABY3SN48_9BACL|nr:response regulator [Paenibacillus sp. YPD9-1]UJF34903.1 response regulator [Paenibacillus sp. YPD9-1]
MYRLLIADDEALEREGLEMMVKHVMKDQFEIYHAENGRRAIQLAEEKRPHIVFMDIKMPGIHGLEAVREILARHPDTRIVMVTAHDFFAYAKEALSLGVKDYILKPAKRDELLDILRKQIDALEEESGKRKEEMEIRLKLNRLLPLAENELSLMLMMDYVQELDLMYMAELLDLEWEKGYAVVISFPYQEQMDWEQFQHARKTMYEELKQYLKLQLPCMVSPMTGNRMAVFIPCPSYGAGYTHRVDSLQWGERLQAFAEGRFGLSACMGIGSVQEGIEGLRQSYQEAAAAAVDSSAVTRIRHFEDMQQLEGTAGISRAEEKRLLDTIQRLSRDEAYLIFSQIFDRLLHQYGENISGCKDELTALFISLARQLTRHSASDLMNRFAGVQDGKALREAVFTQLDRLLDELTEERKRRQFGVMERAKSYIHDHYKLEISMEQTAEAVNLSPYYFSKMFKLHVGETFIDYVTGLRIEEAKQLLEQEELSFKEICYMSGYHDPNYFSRIFKKTTGVTPTEYRKYLQKNVRSI